MHVVISRLVKKSHYVAAIIAISIIPDRELLKFANHENLHTIFRYTLIFFASMDTLGCEKSANHDEEKIHFNSKYYRTKN